MKKKSYKTGKFISDFDLFFKNIDLRLYNNHETRTYTYYLLHYFFHFLGQFAWL